MARECYVLKIFDLDLQLKVTEPFKGQKFAILSSLLPEKVTLKGNLGKCRLISVGLVHNNVGQSVT